MSNLNSKSARIKTLASYTAEETTMAPAMPSGSPLVVTTSNETFVDKAKTFLNKEVVSGSNIKWMYVIGAVLAFVLYVELVADRKTKRSLKFW